MFLPFLCNYSFALGKLFFYYSMALSIYFQYVYTTLPCLSI